MIEYIVKFAKWLLYELDSDIARDIIILFMGILAIIIIAKFLNDSGIDDIERKREYIEPRINGSVGSIANTMINNYFVDEEEREKVLYKNRTKINGYLITYIGVAFIGLVSYMYQGGEKWIILLIAGSIILALLYIIYLNSLIKNE